jgi:hypothetical protein
MLLVSVADGEEEFVSFICTGCALCHDDMSHVM